MSVGWEKYVHITEPVIKCTDCALKKWVTKKKKPYSKEDLVTAFKTVKKGNNIREACRIMAFQGQPLGTDC
jgi:hypothetical protein